MVCFLHVLLVTNVYKIHPNSILNVIVIIERGKAGEEKRKEEGSERGR